MWLHDQRPAVVRLTVRDIAPESDRTYLDETVRVPVGESRRIRDAFTALPDGTTYAMTADLKALTEGGKSHPERMEDSLTFTPADGEGPDTNPIPVVVTTTNRGEDMRMFPKVTIHQTALEK